MQSHELKGESRRDAQQRACGCVRETRKALVTKQHRMFHAAFTPCNSEVACRERGGNDDAAINHSSEPASIAMPVSKRTTYNTSRAMPDTIVKVGLALSIQPAMLMMTT